MARNVWEYFEERKLECERLGLYDLQPPTFAAKDGTGEKEGRVDLRLGMTESAAIYVMERVVVGDNSVHRTSYAYYLVINGQEYLARDLDSVHGYHGHEIGHSRIPADRVTFKEFVEMAWETVHREEELAGAEQ
jgi:hypothetical protein